MNCEEAREWLSARLDDPALAATPALEGHLAACAECRAVEAEYRGLDGQLEDFYTAGYHPGFTRGLLRNATPPPNRWRRWGWTAAAVLFLSSAGLVFSLFGPPAVETAAPAPPTPPTPPGPPATPHRLQGLGAGHHQLESAELWVSREGWVERLAGRRLRGVRGEFLLRVRQTGEPFLLETPGGTVTVTGTEFSVSVRPAGDRVALRTGSVQLTTPAGSLTLAPGEAALLGAARPPQPLTGVSVASETLWRAWETLLAEEQTERYAHLKQVLSQEEYAARLEARRHLAQAGAERFAVVCAWLESPVPRLRLEAVLFLRGAPPGSAEILAALERISTHTGEQPQIRDQARLTLRLLAPASARKEGK